MREMDTLFDFIVFDWAARDAEIDRRATPAQVVRHESKDRRITAMCVVLISIRTPG
jgi:hypothetical protein